MRLQHIADVYDRVPGVGATARTILLGEGGTANVYKIVHKQTKAEYALKHLDLGRFETTQKRKLVLHELAVLKALRHNQHPGIARAVEVFRTEDDIYLVMELCAGGELFDALLAQPDSRYSEEAACGLAKEMLAAVGDMHVRGMVHRDIKLENFLFKDKGNARSGLRLIDFGFSRKHVGPAERMTDLVGTPYYMAPELIARAYRGAACDMWSLGVVLFMMLCGDPPFDGDTKDEIMAEVTRQAASPPALQKLLREKLASAAVSAAAADMVCSLLQVDPSTRLTAAGALQHPWLGSYDASGERPRDSPLLKRRCESADSLDSGRGSVDNDVVGAPATPGKGAGSEADASFDEGNGSDCEDELEDELDMDTLNEAGTGKREGWVVTNEYIIC